MCHSDFPTPTFCVFTTMKILLLFLALLPSLVEGKGLWRRLQQHPSLRALRVRIFVDSRNWFSDAGMADDAGLGNWIVSIDGKDVGSTREDNGYLLFEETETQPLYGGMKVCIRPPFTEHIPSEQACEQAGYHCVQESTLLFSLFPFLREIMNNRYGGGLVWYDYGSLTSNSLYYKVFVKDYCYTLRRDDFLIRDTANFEAWVRFSVSPDGPTPGTGPTAAPTNDLGDIRGDVVTPPPTDSPTKNPTIAPTKAPTKAPTPAPVLCGNGVCEAGENCSSCPSDCASGTVSNAVCGNGVCEAGDGEDFYNCPSDCLGKTNGKNTFACGVGGQCNGDCSKRGLSCTTIPVGSSSFCCGDGVCSAGESAHTCSALDCF